MAFDVLERVHKLIALAESANEHEARNAAVLACKAIIQHKLELSLPGSRPFEGNPAQQAAPKRTQKPWEPKADKPPRKPREPKADRPPRRPRMPRKPKPGKDVVYHVKFAPGNGKCKWCGIKVWKGEQVVHAPRRYVHLDCAQRAKAWYGGKLPSKW